MSNADDVLTKLREKAALHGMNDADVAHAVADAIRKVAGALPPADKLYHELTDLAAYIKSSRQELVTLQAAGNLGEHIPSATDELDAVTEATAEATHEIMNQCEAIGAIADRVGGEEGQQLHQATGRIFEACAFQDITGQRIAKVVRTLKHIELQVNKLVELFGRGAPDADLREGDDKLLNGPQLPTSASSQDEIDQLLASLDEPSA